MKRQTLLLALVFGMSLLGAREAICKDTESAIASPELSKPGPVGRSPWDVSVTLKPRGRLVINGTRNDDHVEVNNVVADTIEVIVFRSKRRRSKRSSHSYPVDLIDSITFLGENGNDNLWTVMLDVPVYAFGGNGNDRLEGGANEDLLIGGSGHDDLIGKKSDDFLFGGTGDDDLYGGRGTDTLIGYDGDDYLDGQHDGEMDSLSGGEGVDTFVGYYVRIFEAETEHLVTGSLPEDDFRDFDKCEDIEEKIVVEVRS